MSGTQGCINSSISFISLGWEGQKGPRKAKKAQSTYVINELNIVREDRVSLYLSPKVRNRRIRRNNELSPDGSFVVPPLLSRQDEASEADLTERNLKNGAVAQDSCAARCSLCSNRCILAAVR
jgi:hypothetical protein